MSNGRPGQKAAHQREEDKTLTRVDLSAAAGSGWAAWEGEEQEISSLQESTALIPDVSNSMVTLMDERMTLKLGKFSDFSSFILIMSCLPTGGVATLLYKGCRAAKTH